MSYEETSDQEVEDWISARLGIDAAQWERIEVILQLVFYGFLAGIALVLLYQTQEFGDNPTDYGLPRAIAVIFLALIAIQITAILRPSLIDRFKAEAAGDAFDEFAGSDDEATQLPTDVLKTIGWVVGFVGLIYLFGFTVAIPIFIGGYVWYNLGWKKAVVTTVIFSIAGYLLFIRLLGISLHEGILRGFLGI